MIYREHPFSVVQTSNPAGWKWTVQLNGSQSKTGESHRRESAIVAAWSAIDKVLKATAQNEAVTHTVVDGRMIAKPAA
jgi:hypothetical protein